MKGDGGDISDSSGDLEQAEQQLSLLPENSPATEEVSPAMRGSPSRPLLSNIDDDEDNLPLITADWPDASDDHELEANLGEIMKLGKLHEHPTRPQPDFKERRVGLQVHESGHFVPVPGGSSLETSSVGGSQLFGGSIGSEVPLFGNSSIEIDTESKFLSREDETNCHGQEGSEHTEGTGTLVPFPVRAAVTDPTPPVGQTLQFFDDLPTDNTASEELSLEVSTVHRKERTPPSWLMSGVYPISLLSSVPVACLALFYLWSTNFSATPTFISSLVAVQSGEEPRVPPPGFEVVGLEPKVEIFDSGKNLLELRGSVVNRSPKTYRDVRIEASLFDKENRLIERRVIDSSNGLSTVTSLTSLKPEVIEELQEKRGITHNVKSLEAMPFRVIFPTLSKEAAYYSARVFSVRPVSG